MSLSFYILFFIYLIVRTFILCLFVCLYNFVMVLVLILVNHKTFISKLHILQFICFKLNILSSSNHYALPENHFPFFPTQKKDIIKMSKLLFSIQYKCMLIITVIKVYGKKKDFKVCNSRQKLEVSYQMNQGNRNVKTTTTKQPECSSTADSCI